MRAERDDPAASAPHPRLIIDLAAIRRNYARLKELSAPAAVAAVVKADAYGLGAGRIGPALAAEGCGAFFVATAAEGTSLRRALKGVKADIYIFNGYWPEDAALLREANLIPVVNDMWQLEALRAGAPWPFALHVDTGINRLGAPAEAVLEQAQAGAFENMDLRLVMSHLACADEPGHSLNDAQRDSFAAITTALPGVPASLANSAGVMLGAPWRFDVTRPGIAIYGGAPVLGEAHPFEPVVRIEAPVLQLRRLKPGDSVGYGATFETDEPRLAAVVGLGYADGLFRAAQSGGYGRFANHRLPIMGRVSMDLVTLDATGAEGDIHPGDMVTFMGEDIEALAAASGTISYELLVRLGARFERIYQGG
ncbi:MAG: alanine racemase [Maricaulaceae bacterium]|nr:alanine racemase [Maricaulaceae bacterium]